MMQSVSTNRSLWRRARSSRRGAFVLLVTLAIITIISLLGASLAFRTQADTAAVMATQNRQKARFAADSGLDWVMYYLRENRFNAFGDGETNGWYDNPELFKRIIIATSDDDGETVVGATSEVYKERRERGDTWRFSVVAAPHITSEIAPGDQDKYPRYGITAESSKININVASRGQLLALFEQIEVDDEEFNPADLVDALIDWRDEDDELTGLNSAESSYYITMNPSYKCKNAPFDTVEELLMVKGFTGRILYGEDYNGNGYLDENEDDGEEEGAMFPPDNGDGILNRGLLPYLTVHTWDLNSAKDNTPRVNINTVDFDKLAESEKESDIELLELLNEDTIQFITEARKRKYRFRSIGELYGLEVYEDGSSNYSKAWNQHRRAIRAADKAGLEEFERQKAEEERQRREEERAARRGEDDADGEGIDPLGEDDADAENGRDKKPDRRREQSVSDAEDGAGVGEVPNGEVSGETAPPDGSNGGGADGDGRDGENGEEDDAAKKGTPIVSPIEGDQLAICLDRFTALPLPIIPGLINANTAPEAVLVTVPGLSEEDAANIVATRGDLSSDQLESIAWLVTDGVLEAETFAVVSNQLTSRSIQFTVDVVGFADHAATASRIQAVIEVRGQVSHVKYYRDLTEKGVGYDLWLDEEE